MKVLEYKMAQEAKALIEEPSFFKKLIRGLDNTLNAEDFMIRLIPAIWDEKKQVHLGARLIFQPKEREKDQALWDEWFTELEVSQLNSGFGLWLNTLRGCILLMNLDAQAVKTWRVQMGRASGILG